MPAKIKQGPRAESFDLRNLATMLNRVYENTTRPKKTNDELAKRIVELRTVCERLGYGAQLSIPATLPPAPPDLPVVSLPAERRRTPAAARKATA